MALRGHFRKWLFASASVRRGTSNLEIYPLDVDAIAAELDLKEEARRLARAGLPLPHQTAISAAEARATQRIEKARQDYVEWAGTRLGHLNEFLSRSDATPTINHTAGADKEFERTASTHLAENAPLLEDLAARAATCERELDTFRARNRLERGARYPEGSAAFLRYSVLALMIVVEGALNAFFFSQGLDSGLLGGFVYAALLAALNLGAAFVIGKTWIPFAIHREAALRAVGVLGVAAALLCMGTIGLTIAHFRDALAADLIEPARAAWTTLRASSFALRDPSSWLLFAISVAFAIAALVDGVSSDDVYPGYGRCDRRARGSKDDYLDQLQEVREELEEMKDQALEAFDERLKTIQTCIARYEGLIADKRAAWNKLQAASANAESCLDALLKTFRDANQIERMDGARPLYFDARPSLRKLALPELETARDEAALRQQRAMAARLVEQAPLIRARIQASFNIQYDMLKPIDAHFALIRVNDEKESSLAAAT